MWYTEPVQYRWFHSPQLHSPGHGKERKVGWLELFYDLIYVATIIQLGNGLSHNVSVKGFLIFAGLFIPVWQTWTTFTFYANRFVVDDFAHRIIVFTQMFCIGAMAVSVPAVVDHGDTQGFALAYTGVRITLLLLYLRTWLQTSEAREMTKRSTAGFLISVVLWGISAFLPAPWSVLLWACAILVDFAIPLTRHARELAGRYPPDVLHMSERYGLFTIIVLGESFVKVLSEVAAQPDPGTDMVMMAGLALMVTASLWWLYFDDVAGSRVKPKPINAFVWIYTHLPLTIAVTGVGVAVKKAVVGMSFYTPAPAKYRWLLCGTFALALAAIALIDMVTERRHAEMSDRYRVNARLLAIVGLLLIAATGGYMPSWAFLAIVAAAGFLQVLFDISMVPMAMTAEEAHHDQAPLLRVSEESHDRDEDVDDAPKKFRPDTTLTVRKGAPSHLRRDLYFHMMAGSWSRMFVYLLISYVSVNILFAALYMLEPGSVENVAEGSFLDAFWFSVQTFSTIGYGGMSPITSYGNLLVTIEAAIGLLGVALATGLLFAKASRPSSGALFSKKLVVTQYDGKPTLMFRLGNARGNEVVEAQLKVAALIDTVTSEGHKMRRLFDLKLERSNTPLFTLTWSVMHVLDETSPLYGVPIDDDHVALFVATMTGHDATYGHTIHARQMWYPENVFVDHHFVDVLSTSPEGNFVVDYDLFHTVAPDKKTA